MQSESAAETPFLTMAFPRSADPDGCGEFATLLGEIAGVEIGVTVAESYERMAKLLAEGKLDLAWLSPLPYIALSAAHHVEPLVFHERTAKHYCSAIVVHASSPIRRIPDLKGKRASWVDRHSAAGFVVPRIQLAAAGLDPRSAFSKQAFAGSHEGVVDAVLSSAADFGATYAHRQPDGTITGPWSNDPERAANIRVLTTFGKIPPDLLVARAEIDLKVRTNLARALRAMNTRAPALIHELFDVEQFRLLDTATYEALREMALAARDQGLLDFSADDDPDSTAPRPAVTA